eukprot:6204487-Pleurochrysis_carterae.AAC.3
MPLEGYSDSDVISDIATPRRVRTCGALHAPLPKFWIPVARMANTARPLSRPSATYLGAPSPRACARSPTALSCMVYN